MIAIAIILGLVFILIICIIVYAYHKDIVELENRILQLEKRQTDEKKDLTWQIQWETKLRNDGEKEINNGNKYICVTSSHNDWGNDNIDSLKSADVHEECLQEYLKWLFSKDSIIASLQNKQDWEIRINTEWCDVPSIMVGSDKE